MRKRKQTYIILSIIIVAEFLVMRIVKDYGILIESGFLKAIGGIVFYLPIVGLLFYISNDPQLKGHWKIILRILLIFIALAFVVGTFLSLFINV